MKKLLIVLLSLLALALLLVGCTGDDTPDTAGTTAGDTSAPGDTTTGDTSAPGDTTAPESETEAPYVYEPAPLPAAVNVAREGFAIASSALTDKGYSNLQINDGDPAAGHSSSWDASRSPTDPHYIFIDLAARQTVESVKLYPLAGDEAGFPVDFDIQVSDDNLTYTTVASVDGAKADAAGVTVSFDRVETQYVKLVTRKVGVGEGDKGAYLALGEFEVYAVADTSANMILNRDDIWLYKDPDVTQQLQILYYRDGTAVDPAVKLTYEVVDPAVATVSESGLITPVAAGETDVYVYDGRNRATCHVEVKVESRDEFRVTTFYHSNFGTPETYVKGLQIIKDAGVEYIEDTRYRDRVGNNITMYMIELCDRMGLAYSVCDQEGGEGGYLEMTNEEILAIVQKYENRAGLYGLYMRDEPHEEYTQYAEVFRLMQEYNPHLIPHLNLLPPYNFGGTEEHYTEFAAVAGGARRMRYLSYDHYPFVWNNGFNAQMYESLNMVRTAGLTYNCDTGYYLQSMIITGSYPLLYERELRYNASLGMAYGMKNYKWFVALTPISSDESFQTGLVGPDFNPADNHADIAATNAMVKRMGVLLGNSDAIEVYHTSQDYGAVMLPADFLFQPVGAQSAIYTLYESLDGKGKQAILLTNKDFRATESATLTVRVAKDVGPLSYFDPLTGETTALTLTDSTFTVTLKPGACGLVLLPEGVDAARPAVKSDNLALGKGVFCSSSSAEFWADGNIGTHFLTDGDPANGYWLCDNRDRSPYLLIDLGASMSVSKLHIYTHTALGSKFCKAFTVQVSEDGVNYTDVTTVEKITFTDTGSPYECAFDTVNARYIRIRFNVLRPMQGMGEIEVYA